MPLRRFFRWPVLPGWILAFLPFLTTLYAWLDFWGNAEFALQKLQGRAEVWQFLLSPVGNLVVLIVGLVWIFATTRRAHDPNKGETVHRQLRWVRTEVLDEPGRGFTPKVRIELRSTANTVFRLATARWETKHGLRVRENLPSATWQVRGGFGTWHPSPDGDEHVLVNPGEHCRTWVAFDPSFSTQYLGQRIDQRTLGTLVVLIDGEERAFQI